jgi:hypothetical protein
MADSQKKMSHDFSNKSIHLMDLNDYNELIEELRVRLNILSTSVFLLKDSYKGNNSPNQNRYFEKINEEMNKIKTLISNHPREINYKHSLTK